MRGELVSIKQMEKKFIAWGKKLQEIKTKGEFIGASV